MTSKRELRVAAGQVPSSVAGHTSVADHEPGGNAEVFVYAGFAKCGCMVAVTVDSPINTSVGDDVKEFIVSGLTIERIELERFREFKLGHTDACKAINRSR